MTTQPSNDQDRAARLHAAIRGRPLALPQSAEDVRELASAALYHGVGPSLLRAFNDHSVASELTELRSQVNQKRATALLISVTALRVAEHLAQSGITYVLVKGPMVAAAHPNRDRTFTDVDVLVAPACMPKTISALAEMGATILDQHSWPRVDGVGEIPLGLPNAVTIDLHADLIHHAEVRRAFRWPVQPLLDRAVSVELHGSQVRTLNPEDHIIYVALHAMLSGGHRLVWFVDLDAMIRSWSPNWEVVVLRAQSAGLGLVLGTMLQRTVDLLDSPVPPKAVAQLLNGGRGWNRFLRRLELRNPITLRPGPRRTGQFFVRATRQGTLTSLLALAKMGYVETLRPRLPRRAREH